MQIFHKQNLNIPPRKTGYSKVYSDNKNIRYENKKGD